MKTTSTRITLKKGGRDTLGSFNNRRSSSKDWRIVTGSKKATQANISRSTVTSNNLNLTTLLNDSKSSSSCKECWKRTPNWPNLRTIWVPNLLLCLLSMNCHKIKRVNSPLISTLRNIKSFKTWSKMLTINLPKILMKIAQLISSHSTSFMLSKISQRKSHWRLNLLTLVQNSNFLPHRVAQTLLQQLCRKETTQLTVRWLRKPNTRTRRTLSKREKF